MAFTGFNLYLICQIYANIPVIKYTVNETGKSIIPKCVIVSPKYSINIYLPFLFYMDIIADKYK